MTPGRNFLLWFLDNFHNMPCEVQNIWYTGKKKGVRGMYKFCKTEQSVRRQRELEQGLLAMMEHHRFE